METALMQTVDELTTVATFSNTAEAELAKERLELEGIRAFVVGAVTAHIVPNLGEGGNLALRVGTDDAQTARDVLGVDGVPASPASRTL